MQSANQTNPLLAEAKTRFPSNRNYTQRHKRRRFKALLFVAMLLSASSIVFVVLKLSAKTPSGADLHRNDCIERFSSALALSMYGDALGAPWESKEKGIFLSSISDLFLL